MATISDRKNLEEKIPPCHVGKADGSGDDLAEPPKCMPHHIDGMAGGKFSEKHEAPLYSKQWKEQLLCAFLVWAMEKYEETHMFITDILHRVTAVWTPIVKHPLVNIAATW